MNPIRETHAGGVLRVSAPPGAWGSVPLALIEDVRLDLAARAVAIWLATRPAGWQISVAHLLSALHLGRDRWRRIAGELQSAGYLARSPTPSGPGGRWVWEIVFCAIPTTAGGEFPASAPAQLQKKRRAAPSASPERGVIEIDAPTGIQHAPRNARDAAALAEIRKFPPPEIDRAVAQAAAADDLGRAFPSRVLRALRQGAAAPNSARNRPAWMARRQTRDDDGVSASAKTILGVAEWTD
ncbi:MULTISPECIES: hypothetical protein [unclassified Thiomonas]|uniref:hypothetical protein n=1 Tax=unclassified Thiomonas TaxID=2625466 RepID=UPI0012A92EEB|nr:MULTISPECIES: hypothetical protein [unclassified Thiomonas]VDY06731.1 protein of unknown function [Thiomonas sp. Bio17B3]VDY09975.1 protein of unknown function [Thiomonas sp. Sup16B3]VDY11217.1 protein of unknown function [Thiomonas sp. Sup16B3]VDY11244.1 protein of unknown function [Thiomonas sp. Bio17B3]VDY15005.1 protein of unknown function [Thiomonas sp. OC7]